MDTEPTPFGWALRAAECLLMITGCVLEYLVGGPTCVLVGNVLFWLGVGLNWGRLMAPWADRPIGYPPETLNDTKTVDQE